VRRVDIGGRTVEIPVRVSRRARKLSLHVDVLRNVEIVVPPRTSQENIDALLFEHRAWLERELAKPPKTFHLGLQRHTENGWLGVRTVFRNRQIKLPYATGEDRVITDKLILQLNGLQRIGGKIVEDTRRGNDLVSALHLFLHTTRDISPEYQVSAIPLRPQTEESTPFAAHRRLFTSRGGELDRNRPNPLRDNSLASIQKRLAKWQAPRRR